MICRIRQNKMTELIHIQIFRKVNKIMYNIKANVYDIRNLFRIISNTYERTIYPQKSLDLSLIVIGVSTILVLVQVVEVFLWLR